MVTARLTLDAPRLEVQPRVVSHYKDGRGVPSKQGIKGLSVLFLTQPGMPWPTNAGGLVLSPRVGVIVTEHHSLGLVRFENSGAKEITAVSQLDPNRMKSNKGEE